MLFPHENPKQWHFELRKWRQTVLGFLIGYFKNTRNLFVPFSELARISQPLSDHLRKQDGKRKIEGDVRFPLR